MMLFRSQNQRYCFWCLSWMLVCSVPTSSFARWVLVGMTNSEKQISEKTVENLGTKYFVRCDWQLKPGRQHGNFLSFRKWYAPNHVHKGCTVFRSNHSLWQGSSSFAKSNSAAPSCRSCCLGVIVIWASSFQKIMLLRRNHVKHD